LRDESESLSDAELSLKRFDDIGAAVVNDNGWLEGTFVRPVVAPVVELKFDESKKRKYFRIKINCFIFFFEKQTSFR